MADRIIFENRKDAGEQLGKYLAERYHVPNMLVLGIPRGGMETAYYIAKILRAELFPIISKKLPFPGHAEYGFGAIAEENTVYVPDTGSSLLSEKAIGQIVETQQLEVERRINTYRQGRSLPGMDQKTVILVDDGIATGATLVPAIRLCRKKGAGRVIVAAPVSGKNYDSHLREADAIEVLVQPDDFHAVSQVYGNFSNLSDMAVMDILSQAENEAGTKP